ncbi:MAG TPA: Rieske 2Fe-2S domain-containing protein [Ilumatobacteraceae bacterium]|nr:Rieske 2Fe-2S domain-containing protein [Ilumatobacteraceae bacterium]
MQSGVLQLLTSDAIVIRSMNKLATELGLRTTRPHERIAVDPTVVVIDLEQPGAIDEVALLRARHPDAIIVGHLSAPDRERWIAAETAGCDVVANRGAAARQLLAFGVTGRAELRHIALVDAADVAGRLGLLRAIAETPCGPIALYRIGSALCAIADRCPHAGAQLSGGLLEANVVTCPRHGSQFDVLTGDRLRGPSDEAVARYEVRDHLGRVELMYSARASDDD